MMHKFDPSLVYKCQEYHQGQLDRQGAPYWLHPYRVALSAAALCKTDEMIDKCFRVGLAHDILEDCEDVDPLKICADILRGDWMLLTSVALLTKPSILYTEYWDTFQDWDEDYISRFEFMRAHKDYDDLIQRMVQVSDGHMEVLYVKYADNVDNSQPWRAKPGEEAGKKYKNSMKLLGDILSLN